MADHVESCTRLAAASYNRLKLSMSSGVLSYERIGVTQSFGTVHFAPDTIVALNESARLADANRRRVNNLFGEGTSPKMRLVRAGLETLGLDSDVFLRHHSPRLLYGANLCSNLPDLLIGLSEKPKYVLPAGPESTAILIDHWRERWLARRLQRADICERVAEHRVDDFLLGRDPAVRDGGFDGRRADFHDGEEYAPYRASVTSDDATFVERLYRSTKSYADRLDQDELNAIHVDLGVEGYLVEEAGAGKQVIITGNPGDGKTHLIERLRPQLEALGAEVITDANAVSDPRHARGVGSLPRREAAVRARPLTSGHCTSSSAPPRYSTLRRLGKLCVRFDPLASSSMTINPLRQRTAWSRLIWPSAICWRRQWSAR